MKVEHDTEICKSMKHILWHMLMILLKHETQIHKLYLNKDESATICHFVQFMAAFLMPGAMSPCITLADVLIFGYDMASFLIILLYKKSNSFLIVALRTLLNVGNLHSIKLLV